MLAALMLLAGGSAWSSTTYYLIGSSSSDNPADWGKLAECTDGYTFTVNLAYGSNYVAISTSLSISNYISAQGKSYSFSPDDAWDFETKPWGDYYYVRANVKNADTYTISYDGSTYTLTKGAFTVSTSITGGEISPTSISDVTSGSSVSFEVTPTSGYTCKSATYSGGLSGDISQSGNTFTFSPTSGGTFTVVYALKYTVTPSISGGTISPSTPQPVYSGEYIDFTVTPNEDYTYKSVSYSGTGTAAKQGDTDVFRVTPTSSGTVSIVYTGEAAPTIRIGKEPSFNALTCGLTLGAYVAQTGCNDVTEFNLYYSNNSMFRTDGNYNTTFKNVPLESPYPDINDNIDITLTANDLEQVVNPGDKLYLRVQGKNSKGWSAFSDVVPVTYECNKFVKSDLERSFKACPGEHQFKWSDMFLSPTPTTWSATLGGNNATSDFSLVNGQMIWNTTGKTKTSYTYVFTAKKDGYADATATLTITYTVPPATTGAISTLEASVSETTPYQPVTLSATGEQGDITTVEWTSTPASATFSNMSGDTVDDNEPTAVFKADKVGSAIDYTVTVTGYNASCGSSAQSVKIKVKPDTEEECD